MSSRASSERESRAFSAWVQLRRGHAATRRTVAARLQADHGLTVSEYEALLLLQRAKEACMRRVDLAEGLQLTASGVTRLLEGLEAQGFVKRATCESDARVCYAVLTETGRKRLDRASSSHEAAVEALFEERYSARELATLGELLARLPAPRD